MKSRAEVGLAKLEFVMHRFSGISMYGETTPSQYDESAFACKSTALSAAA